MNPTTQSVIFNEQAIDVVFHNGEAWIPGEAIGRALEYDRPRDRITEIYRRHKDELAEFSVTLKLRVEGVGEREIRVYNEEGVMIITMLSRQPKAAEFRRWAVRVLKAYRHNELPSPPPATEPARLDIAQTEYIDLLKAKIELLEIKQRPRTVRRISPQERADIEYRLRSGQSVGAISRHMGRNPSSIRNIKRELNGQGRLL